MKKDELAKANSLAEKIQLLKDLCKYMEGKNLDRTRLDYGISCLMLLDRDGLLKFVREKIETLEKEFERL